jgi:hypothetical protein
MSFNRRQFLHQGAFGLGVAVLGRLPMEAASEPNPFAYKIDHLARTDPKLLRYEQTGMWRCPAASPRQVAIGPEDRIHVATAKGVGVFASDGALLAEIPTPSAVRCVALAKDGTIYAGLRSRVEVFSAKHQSLPGWDVPDKKAWLTGIAVTEKDVFLADSGNRVILRYDRAGKQVKRIGEKDKDRNIPGLIVPSPYLDVKVAPDGLLRVNNPGRHRVEAYTFEGDLEFAWGKPTAAIEGFCGCCNPIGLALLPDGRMVTCEKGLPRVKVYTATGEFESVVAGPESFPENARTGSVRDANDGTMGGLHAAVTSQGRIVVLDLATGNVTTLKAKT